MACLIPPAAVAEAAGPGAAEGERAALRVVTFNVWHGLRTEGKVRFPDEGLERKRRRFAIQAEELRRLEPDVVLLQEVNPNPSESRRYARVLGMKQLHRVTSCGLHLGFLLKIPINVNEGLTLLARPELALRGLGSRLLSGKNRCWGDHLGFQTSESRYVLFGEIAHGGRRVLLAVTHLHPPPVVPRDFERGLAELVRRRRLSPEQRSTILSKLAERRQRTLGETRRLLEAIEELSGAGAFDAVVLAGDFNSTPGSPVVSEILGRGYREAVDRAEAPIVTYDPVANRENYLIGSRERDPLPTFGVPELRELLGERDRTARQIDYLFVAGDLEPVAGAVVLNEARDGLYPSDHFGLVADLRLR